MKAETQPGLVFASNERGRIPWTLLGFIMLSAFVHAFGFFLFQTIYPGAGRVMPPPVQVSLIAPGTPEADAILRWIQSEDPALPAQPTMAPFPPPGLTDLPYIPSYSSVHARPKMAPSTDTPLPYPAGASGLDLVEMAASHPAPPPAPPAPAPTSLSFSGPLEGAVLESHPAFETLHATEPGEQLQPARFLLGVSDKGEVKYLFILNTQDSSGDETLDESASDFLRQSQFRPSAEPLTWGFATFYWGSAVFAPTPPTPEPSP
jgi:hypothetical protein